MSVINVILHYHLLLLINYYMTNDNLLFNENQRKIQIIELYRI